MKTDGGGEWRNRGAFSLLEILAVLGILGLLAGLGVAGADHLRRTLEAGEIRTRLLELSTACRLYRLENGGWPKELEAGEPVSSDLIGQLAPFLEGVNSWPEWLEADGRGTCWMAVDADGDGRIGTAEWNGQSPLPDGLWAPVVVWMEDGEGRRIEESWE